MIVELICEYCDNVLGYVRASPPFTPPSLWCFKRVVMRSGVGSTPPSPPPVIDSRCAMNNLLMLCAIQVRGQIDFMRVGVGVGGAYAYSALMCSMPRVCAACALCYTSPTCLHPPTIIYRTHTPCLLYWHHLLTRRVKC